MPDHQSHRSDYNNNNNTISHTYSKHTLLAHKPKLNTKQTQLIMTSTLSNNQINNYNLEHTQNRIRNNSSKIKTHYRTRFKQNTHSSQSKHISKLNAFRGDSPRTVAAAPLPRGNNWRVPRYSCTTDPLGSVAPPVQLHYGALDTPLISNPTTTAVPTTTEIRPQQETQETQQQQQLQQTQTQQQQEQQQQQQQQHTHTETQDTINNKYTYNNNDNNEDKIMEPHPQLPSRGSTGQPRSCQQFFDKGNMEKTCGDQKQPTQPPRKRNTNRGIRNPNTIEIRREKRTNKRRVARREKRQEGWGII